MPKWTRQEEVAAAVARLEQVMWENPGLYWSDILKLLEAELKTDGT